MLKKVKRLQKCKNIFCSLGKTKSELKQCRFSSEAKEISMPFIFLHINTIFLVSFFDHFLAARL